MDEMYSEDEPSWEEDARDAIERVMSDAVFDEVRGTVTIWLDIDHSGNLTRSEFVDYDSLYFKLIEIGELAWVATVPWEGGPVFEPSVEDYVNSAIVEYKIEDFFFHDEVPSEADELIVARDLISPEGAKILRFDLSVINDELVKYMVKHPESMYQLKPRKFEELIAELFKDMGYDVELTPATRDGGFDLRLISKLDVGSALTLVECKRFAPNRKVGVSALRSLYGVVEAQSATRGIIITSSSFTSSATAFHKKQEFRLALADYNNIVSFLKQYGKH